MADLRKASDPIRNDVDQVIDRMIAQYTSIGNDFINGRDRQRGIQARADALMSEYAALAGPGGLLDGRLSPEQQNQVNEMMTAIQTVTDAYETGNTYDT